MDAIKNLPPEEAICFLGFLSDSVYSLEHAAGMALIDDAIPAAESLLGDQLVDDTNRIHLHYVLANLWGHRHRLKDQTDEDYTWAWDSEEQHGN